MRTLEQIKKGQIDKDTKLIGGGGVDLAFDVYKSAMEKSKRSNTPVVAGGTVNPVITYEKGVQGNRNLNRTPAETYVDAVARNRAKASELSNIVTGAKATVQDVKDILFSGRNYTHVNPTYSFGKEYDTMTPEEAGAYVALTKQGKTQQAKEYLDSLQMELNRRNTEAATQRARETAQRNAAAGVGLDVAGAMSSGAGALYSLWQEARGKAIDPYHPAYGGVAVREGAHEGLIGDSTGIEKFLKEAGLATAEWAGQAFTMGGLAPFSMAAGAAGATSRDATLRGGTTEEAAMLGIVGGAAEAVAEKIGFDRWLKFGDMAALRGNKGQLVAQILKDMGSEGLEEGATEIANILADTVIMGNKSQMAEIYNAAKAQGMTESQAIGEALKTAAGQIGYSAGLGAVSGGMIGGGMAAMGRATGQNPLEVARAQYEAATRRPEVAPDTNVGTTEPTANPSVTPQSVPHAQMVNPSTEAETQAAERQNRARQIVEDKLFYENGQKAFEEEYQRTGKTDHFDAFHTYYSAGVRGVKEADIRQNVFTENADKVMLNKAYIAGAMDRSADLEARKKNAGKVAQTVGVFGAVDKLTEGKRNYLDAISKVMGIEIEVEETAPYNGKYENGRMYVAADAESFVGTVSHEMGHIIRQVVPESYADIEQLVFSRLEKMDGKSYAERLAEYDAKLNRTEGVGRGGYSEAALAEEMICDGLQAIVQSEADAAEFFRSMEQKSPGVLQKLKAFLEDMLQKLRELIGNEAYKEIATDLRQDEAFVKELREAVAKVAVEVGKAEPRKQSQKQAAKTDADVIEAVGAQIDAETQSAAPKMSLRTWNESDYAKDKEKAAQALAKALKIDVEKAEKWIKDINSVAKIIADDREILDYEANLDDSATVLKSNQEYKWTLDMSTLCAKRLWFTGTFDAIQKAMPDTAFTSEEITRIRTMMMEKGYEVACGICYVESTRREIGPITQMFIDQYKKAQKSGKPIARVNSSGKEVELTQKGDKAKRFYAEKGYTPTLADLNTTDIDLVKRDHPEVYAAYLAFMNARGQAKPKLLETRAEYKGEIAKTFRSKTAVKSRNDAGGLRVQSFSDFEVPHMIDMMQAVMDMSKVGLQAQAYTKVPEFAAVFGGTGMKINLSLIAKGDGVDAKGKLIFDDVEGIDHKKAFKLREQYSENVGTILVGKNDRHIIAAMADPRIDYIIPFHKSSWKESLYDALGLTGYGDYTATQNEKPIDKSRKIKNYDPSEYWRFDLSGDENAQIYLERCRKDGRIPKFPEFSSYPGYWKLLIDFKMYDNDGNGSPQRVVRPEFNMTEARKILKAYEGGHRSFPVAQDVVDEFVAEKQGVKFSVRESGEAELRRENASLRSENEHLQKLNENLKRQFILTDGKTPDPKAVRRVAKGWLKQIQSKSDLDDFSMKLGKVAEYFAKAKTDHENEQAMAALRVLVRDAMEEAETLNTEMRDNYSDLIGYIKRTTLKVSDDLKRELEHYGGYNNFRRERFGSMKLSTESGSSIDGFYYSLCQEYPEFFKEEDAADEAEQLMNIAAVLDTLKPVAENPYGYYIDEYVEDEAAGLLNMITDIEMEQTFADKKKAEKVAALKKLKAEFNSTIRQMRKEAKEAQEAAVKKAVYDVQTAERMYHARLTADHLAKYERLKLKQKKMRDTRKRREYRQSLERRAKDLLKRLKGDDKRPIPEEMRAGVEALLTGFSTDRNDTITILQKDVVRVQKAYEAAGNTDEGLDFDDDTKALLDEFAQVFVTKYGARVHLDDLLTEEMKMLRDIVRNLQHIISNANKLKALEKSVEVAAVGDAFLAENGSRKIVAQAGVLRQIGDFFNLDMLDAISFFKRMGDAAYNYIYKGFRNGLDRKITHVKEAVDFMNELVDEKTVKKWRGEKPKKFELTQGEIWLDIPQKMSLYCLMRREQAKLHMYAGGIKADLDRAALRKGKAAAEALKQYTGIMVTEADLNVIVDTLTTEQKKVAEAMQDFMSDNVAGWGNETSMLMFGYKKFTEKNYFPIVSDKDYINTIAGKDENVTQSLRSLGFTKKTLDTANNPIMIQDIFSVFAKHIDQMSSYNAFVPATSDTNKFLNYKGKITDSGKEDNVKTVLRRIMGDKAVGYIHKLVDTINGAVSYSDEGYLPKMLVRNMKISSVGANARVIVQQPVSILRAGAVIDMKYLLGAMSPSRSDFDLIVKYAPIAQWKMWGNYDVNVGRSIEELTSGQNYYQKMTEWMMAGAGMADKFTWGRIWKACELEVKHKHPDWIGDRFYEAVGERFGQIIDETQVVDSPLHRSQMMRSKGLYTQMVTSFMSEPTKTYNMATNAFVRLRQNPTPENRKQFARTVWYLALNAVAVAAAAGLVDAARDDDDEEWADKWLQAFRGEYSEGMNAKDKVITFLGSNVGSGVNPMNYIPYLRDLWSLIEGYDIKRTDFDWAADIMNWMTRVHKFTTGESEYTLASMLANTAGAFSKLFGIPAKSALRDLNAVKNLTVNHLIGDEEMKYENRKLTYAIGSEKNTGDYVAKMLEAEFSGNRSLATKIYNDMVKAGIDNETINSKISSSQKKLMKNEPEIGEAAEAYRTGNIRGYQKAIDSLTGKGYSESEALSAVKSAYNKMIGEEKEEELTFDTITNGYWEDDGEETAESYDYRMLFNAFMDGTQDDYGTLWQMLKDGGKKDSNIRSSMRTRLKGAYWDAKDSGDYNRAEKARKEFLRLGGKPETLTYR